MNIPGVTHAPAKGKQPAPVGDEKESGSVGKDGELSITDARADPIRTPAATADTARKAEQRCFDTANAMMSLLFDRGDRSF